MEQCIQTNDICDINDCDEIGHAFANACELGNFEIVKWMFDKYPIECGKTVRRRSFFIQDLLLANRIDIIRYLENVLPFVVNVQVDMLREMSKYHTPLLVQRLHEFFPEKNAVV